MALFQHVKTAFAEDASNGGVASPLGARSAGDVLRQQRESLGLDLGHIAATLRIKPAYLAALEDGRPDRLPGPAYAAGFVRAYGDHLGLDSREILRRFKVESSGLDAKPDLSFPMPLSERSIPGGAMLLVALILAICGYGAWFYLSTAERSHLERVTEVPVVLLPPKPTPSVPTVTETPSSGVKGSEPNLIGSGEPGPAGTPLAAPAFPVQQLARESLETPHSGSDQPAGGAKATASPAPFGSAISNVPNSGLEQRAAASPSSLENEGRRISRIYGVVNGPARIVMRAVADSWIQIRDADQSPLFTGTLKPGESYQVPDRPGVSMRTGNAGGLEITVDGKSAPSIGKLGVVRRDVMLEPEALMAGTAVRR